MDAYRSPVATSRAAESYLAARSSVPVNDLELRAAADALVDLFEAAVSSGTVRKAAHGASMLVSPPHVFLFHEDRLHRYIHKYGRFDDISRAVNASAEYKVVADSHG